MPITATCVRTLPELGGATESYVVATRGDESTLDCSSMVGQTTITRTELE